MHKCAEVVESATRCSPNRWCPDDVIILCVRWYLRFDSVTVIWHQLRQSWGIAVAPYIILRWVIRYTSEFVRRWERFELVVGRFWRADETYIKVKGSWMYLYRAVDEQGRAVFLSQPGPRRDGSSPLLSSGSEASWAAAQHYARSF